MEKVAAERSSNVFDSVMFHFGDFGSSYTSRASTCIICFAGSMMAVSLRPEVHEGGIIWKH